VSHRPAGHLGDLGAALVDDQLSPEMRDMALAHLAGCQECQRDVEQQRRLKARLRCLAEPSLPLSLALRLAAMKSAPAAPAAAAPPAPDEPPVRLAPTMALPIRDRGPLLSQRRGRLLAGAASLLLFGVASAYAAAGDAQPTSSTGPTGTATNVLSTSGTPAVKTSVHMNDPAFAAMTASFTP
jgi:anti-sigma factor RsiW